MEQHEIKGPAATLAHVWGQYRVWAHTSRELKKELTNWRTAVLILTVLGAVLGVLSSQIAHFNGFGPWASKVPAFLSAIAIALAAFFSRVALSPERERRWVTARSMAESCKPECFKFATYTPPYHESDAWKILLDEIDELERTMEGVWQFLCPGSKGGKNRNSVRPRRYRRRTI